MKINTSKTEIKAALALQLKGEPLISKHSVAYSPGFFADKIRQQKKVMRILFAVNLNVFLDLTPGATANPGWILRVYGDSP